MNHRHYHCLWLIYLFVTHTLSLIPPQSSLDYGGEHYDYSTLYYQQTPHSLERQETLNNYYTQDYQAPSYNETTPTTEYSVTTTTEAPLVTQPTEETTTLAPFTLADIQVPVSFLRIEYMISFTFLGVMYGLGFLVLFQSLCVPAAKLAVTIVYLILLKTKAVDPVTLEQALEQLPPT